MIVDSGKRGMAATIYGSGEFGLTAEAGMYVQDFSVDFTTEEIYISGEGGDDVAASFANPTGAISMTGFINTGTTFASSVGAALVVANDLDAASYISGVADDDAGETITTSIKTGAQARGFKTFDVSAVFKPFMGAVQV